MVEVDDSGRTGVGAGSAWGGPTAGDGPDGPASDGLRLSRCWSTTSRSSPSTSRTASKTHSTPPFWTQPALWRGHGQRPPSHAHRAERHTTGEYQSSGSTYRDQHRVPALLVATTDLPPVTTDTRVLDPVGLRAALLPVIPRILGCPCRRMSAGGSGGPVHALQCDQTGLSAFAASRAAAPLRLSPSAARNGMLTKTHRVKESQ